MRNLIKFPCYSLFLLLLTLIVSPHLYAQGPGNGNGNGGGDIKNSDPLILDVTATSKSVCPTSTINISFTLQNGNGAPNYFTTATQFDILLIYSDNSGNPVVRDSLNTFYLTATELPEESNGAISSSISRAYTIPLNTISRPDYKIEITAVNPAVVRSDLSRSLPFTISDNNYWSGAIDQDWNKAGNWDCDLIPSFINNAVIDDSSTIKPILNTGKPGECKNISISINSSLRLLDNTLNISNLITANANLDALNGTIVMSGTSAQSIPANTFVANRIQNLIINNFAGVSSLGNLEITGFLRLENGNFNTGNNLTLISDENQTALIDGSGNGEVVGLVSMQRYLDKAFGYKYFSSPFQNSVVGDFSPYMSFQDPVSGFPNFYRYDENRRIDSLDLDATGWEPYIENGNSLNIAEGYALNFGTSTGAQTIELIGEVNNGAIPARTLENNHREYTRGFHLVGNPYPSPIDWNAAQGWTRDNIDDGIYFFTASDTSQYTGTYTAYVNDISTGDPMVDGRSSNIIPSMQGFFIKVSDSGTQNKVVGNFGMDNNIRVTEFDQEFLRTQLTDQKALIRLEAGFKGVDYKDVMVIYFSSFATPNFEKEMDAYKLMNTDPTVPSFYNITEDQKELAINAIAYPENAGYKKIPLGIKAAQSGEMKINLASIENISPNLNIYLIDHAKGIGQNLRRKPEYTFNINEGIHNSRFELMFSEEEVINPAIAFNEPFNVVVRNGEIIVKLNLEEDQQGLLRISTMTGQILQIKSGGGKDEVIFDKIGSDGVYIINLQLGKTQLAKKVIVK